MTKEKEEEHLRGQMEDNTQENGKMESNMEKAHI